MDVAVISKLRNGALVRFRVRHDVTQRKAAEMAGVAHTVWNCVETFRFATKPDGNRITRAQLESIAAICNCDVEELFPPEHLSGVDLTSARVRFLAVQPRQLGEEEALRLPAPEPQRDEVEPLDRELLAERIREQLKELTWREREVLKLRYGLGEHNGYCFTLEEVGKIFKVGRERVRGVQASAIRKLREGEGRARLEGFVSEGVADRERKARVRTLAEVTGWPVEYINDARKTAHGQD